MESKLYQLINTLIEYIDEEFILEGHPNTGTFQESLEGEIIEDGKNIIVNIYGAEYGLYLSEGVQPDKVPYTRKTRGQGKGGTSKYITGLKNWVQTKLGISDEREALSIAFAIAQRHTEEGFPIRDGQIGSAFLEHVKEKYVEEIKLIIEDVYDEIIDKKLEEK